MGGDITLDELLVAHLAFDRASYLAALSTEMHGNGWNVGVAPTREPPSDLRNWAALLATTATTVVGLGPIPAALVNLLSPPDRREQTVAADLAPLGAMSDVVFWRTRWGRFYIHAYQVAMAFTNDDIDGDVRRIARYAARLYSRRGAVMSRVKFTSGGEPMVIAHYCVGHPDAWKDIVEHHGTAEWQIDAKDVYQPHAVDVHVRIQGFPEPDYSEGWADLVSLARRMYSRTNAGL